jgi:predicted permease
VGIPLLQGRYLTEEDIAGPENNIIINATAARRLWPDENPVAKRLTSEEGAPLLTVVGVAGAPRLWDYYEHHPAFYVPFGTWANLFPREGWPDRADFVARSAGDPLDQVTAIGREIAALDRRLPAGDFIKVEDRLRSFTARQRLYVQLVTIFAVIGLILAAAGIYGLVSYSVARRTHEIGVRVALGAERGDVLRLVIREGLILIAAGLGIGVAGALALTQVLRNLLYGVTPTDPVTFVAVSLLLMTVGLAACYVPARRATKIDPMTALRYE